MYCCRYATNKKLGAIDVFDTRSTDVPITMGAAGAMQMIRSHNAMKSLKEFVIPLKKSGKLKGIRKTLKELRKVERNLQFLSTFREIML